VYLSVHQCIRKNTIILEKKSKKFINKKSEVYAEQEDIRTVFLKFSKIAGRGLKTNSG
jgi:hypothetical protein